MDGDANFIVVVYGHGRPTSYALECPRWIKYLYGRDLLDADALNMPCVQDALASDLTSSLEGHQQCEEGDALASYLTSCLEGHEQCEEGAASSSSRKRKECEPVACVCERGV